MESEQASNGGERKKLSSRGERMDHHPWEPEVREKMKEKQWESTFYVGLSWCFFIYLFIFINGLIRLHHIKLWLITAY